MFGNNKTARKAVEARESLRDIRARFEKAAQDYIEALVERPDVPMENILEFGFPDFVLTGRYMSVNGGLLCKQDFLLKIGQGRERKRYFTGSGRQVEVAVAPQRTVEVRMKGSKDIKSLPESAAKGLVELGAAVYVK